jgi:hypothetical protein
MLRILINAYNDSYIQFYFQANIQLDMEDSNVMIEWFVFLGHIRNISVSILGSEIGYTG